MYDKIRFDLKDGVATITLDRPESFNALSIDMYGDILDAVTKCDGDEAVRCVVITGAGKHFSAGGDIQRFKRLIESGEYLQEANIELAGRMAKAIRRCGKPVIAMINGTATGAGAGIALACDMRIMTPKSRIIMGFINMGVPGDTGGIFNMVQLAGVTRATEMLMTGAPLSGDEACRIGVANRCVEPEELEAVTYELAGKLAKAPTKAIALQKQQINEFFYDNLDAYSEKEKVLMAACSHSEDFSEAVYAFLEKRPPQFTGR